MSIKIFENNENGQGVNAFCVQGEQREARSLKNPEIQGKKALAIFGNLEYNKHCKEGKEIMKHESTEH